MRSSTTGSPTPATSCSPCCPLSAHRDPVEDAFELLRSLTEVELRRGGARRARTPAGPRTDHRGRPLARPRLVRRLATARPGRQFRARRELRPAQYPGIQEEHDHVFLAAVCTHSAGTELVTGDVANAVETLRRVADRWRPSQAVDPSILRWHEELAEALVAADAPEEAAALLADVRHVANGLGARGAADSTGPRGLCRRGGGRTPDGRRDC